MLYFTRQTLQSLVVLIILVLFVSNPIYADVVHRVAENESLYIIGQKYRVDVEKIIQRNNLRNTQFIYPRQVLIIPGVNKWEIYRVQPGDSLYTISNKLGVSMSALAVKNNLKNWDALYPGQVLFIPPKPVVKPVPQPVQPDYSKGYKVQAGDSLFTISKKLGVSMDALARVNNLDTSQYLEIGQVLKIPPKETQVKPKPAPKPYLVPQYLKQYPDTFYVNGNAKTSTNKIALTFDDGPDDVYTTQILDVLKTYNVRATFFLLGKNIEQNKDVVKRIIQEHHVIGNHSWSHANLPKLDENGVYNEVKNTERSIEQITGVQTSLIRPPYGEVSFALLEQLKNMGYKVINWSSDSGDWRSNDVDQILINTLPDAKGGAIILFHSAGGDYLKRTVQVLPELIYTLKVMGYEFVTVNELLSIPAYK